MPKQYLVMRKKDFDRSPPPSKDIRGYTEDYSYKNFRLVDEDDLVKEYESYLRYQRRSEDREATYTEQFIVIPLETAQIISVSLELQVTEKLNVTKKQPWANDGIYDDK